MACCVTNEAVRGLKALQTAVEKLPDDVQILSADFDGANRLSRVHVDSHRREDVDRISAAFMATPTYERSPGVTEHDTRVWVAWEFFDTAFAETKIRFMGYLIYLDEKSRIADGVELQEMEEA